VRIGEPDPEIAALPDAVRATAYVFDNGEVAWPNDAAEAAINALADIGPRILGLDARTLFADGAVMETPVSAWEPAPNESEEEAVERARQEALSALPFAQSEGTHVLVTW
jgi:hypothetical protein